ncbi:MAG: hypothetical protein QOJ27_2866 [Sphingomonadales bacterium]|nr:hypothetical protein [Sphingomonadales bacterium]
MAEDDGTGLFSEIRARLHALRPWKPDEDNVEGLARTYAGGLYIAARGLSTHTGDALDELADRIRAQVDHPRPDMREIFALETELSRIMPPEVKERRYWEYRARFERVASPHELAAYLASKPPPTPTAGTPSPIGDADNLVLLGHVHRNYLVTVLREQSERDLKHWIQRGLQRGLFLYILVLIALLFADMKGWVPKQVLYFGVGLSLLFLVGRLGAATSVVQRLQKAVREEGRDAFFEVTALCTGRRGISIAMMEGGIFAILLYIIFGAGLGQHLGMSGGIFPQVEVNSPADRTPDSGAEAGTADEAPIAIPEATGTGAAKDPLAGTPPPVTVTRPPPPAGRSQSNTFGWKSDPCDASNVICMPSFISQIGKHLGFRDYPDFFKMLLLAFLAGFAERLVPDALDRLVQRRSSVADNVAPAVAAGSTNTPPKVPLEMEVNWDAPDAPRPSPPPPPPGAGG